MNANIMRIYQNTSYHHPTGISGLMEFRDVNVSNSLVDTSSPENETINSFLLLAKPLDVPYIRALYIFFYSVIFCCCILGNAAVMYVILCHRKMRNITNFFLANLAASDLCVGLFCVLPSLSTFLSPHWYLGRVLCKLFYFIQCASYSASILILTVISLERYFAIIHPMLNKRITRMYILRWIVVIVWLCAAIYGIPNLVAYDVHRVPSGEHENMTLDFCIINGDWQMDMEVYCIVNFIVLYVVPLVCISFMYVRISMALWRSGSNLANSTNSYLLPKNGREISARKKCEYCLASNRVSVERRKTEFSDVKDSVESEASNKETEAMERRRKWFSQISPATWSDSADIELPHQELSMRLQCTCRNSGSSGHSSNSNAYNPRRKRSIFRRSRSQRFSQSTSRFSVNPLLARRKVIRLLISIIAAFALCVLPHHIRLLWQYWSEASVSYNHMLIPPTTFLFFYANSALNPFLYALLSDHYRKAFRDLVSGGVTCMKSSENHVNQQSIRLQQSHHWGRRNTRSVNQNLSNHEGVQQYYRNSDLFAGRYDEIPQEFGYTARDEVEGSITKRGWYFVVPPCK